MDGVHVDRAILRCASSAPESVAITSSGRAGKRVGAWVAGCVVAVDGGCRWCCRWWVVGAVDGRWIRTSYMEREYDWKGTGWEGRYTLPCGHLSHNVIARSKAKAGAINGFPAAREAARGRDCGGSGG